MLISKKTLFAVALNSNPTIFEASFSDGKGKMIIS
jgi:hypothetical protein